MDLCQTVECTTRICLRASAGVFGAGPAQLKVGLESPMIKSLESRVLYGGIHAFSAYASW